MILYDLRCSNDHLFEAWFANSASYDAQSKAGEVVCPLCNSRKVTKAPMAPSIARRGAHEQGDDQAAAQAGQVRNALRELRKRVEEACEDVGPRFAEEARRIHYGETEPRGIYGESSDSDYAELREEGIEVRRIPWLPREES